MRQIALEKSQWSGVCKIGTGTETCRYLIAGSVGFQCAKLEPELKSQLDERVLKNNITAQGDNCEGKPMFKEE